MWLTNAQQIIDGFWYIDWCGGERSLLSALLKNDLSPPKKNRHEHLRSGKYKSLPATISLLLLDAEILMFI